MIDRVSLEKLEKGFAVGAVVAAFALGGLLYAVYPNSFSGYSSTNTASTDQLYTGEETSTAGVDNSTASQNATDVSQGSASNPQPSGNSGY